MYFFFALVTRTHTLIFKFYILSFYLYSDAIDKIDLHLIFGFDASEVPF